MKKVTFNIIGFFTLICLVSSCTKDLNQLPISSVTTDNFFSTKNDFLQAMTATYAVALRGTAGNSYGYPDRQLNLSETRSDNLYAVTDGARDWEGINAFATTITTNTYVGEAYDNNFKAISKANLLIEQLAANGKLINDVPLMNRMGAEARFLRAFCYFDLVRWFGKVPLIKQTVSAEAATTIPRSPVSDVYDFIISDLKYAIDSLPLTYAAADRGRATKNAAKSILALVYMTRSAPTYGIEGPGLGLNEWDKAYALLSELTAYSAANPTILGFNANYKDTYSYTNENNKEVIFDVQYQSGGLGLGGSFVWILTPDGYFQSLGLNAQGSNYQRPVSNDFLSKFPTTDLRRQFAIQDGFTYQTTIATYSFYKKWIDVSKYGSSRTDWPVNFIISSYTDVLLLKAECTLHGGGGSQTDVDNVVTQVRARAGQGPLTSVTLAQLMEERRKEFCGEGKRWHDLVRSGQIKPIITAWIAADDAVGKRINPFVEDFIIYPIPLSEMNVKPGLYTQNRGYDL